TDFPSVMPGYYPNWRDIPTPRGTDPRGSGAAAAALGGRLDSGHEGRVDLLQHHRAVDDALADVVARRQLVHHVEQHLFEDGPQAPGARPPQQGLIRHGTQRVLGELQLDVVELEELLELLGQGVLRLHEDPDERLLVEAVDGADDRQPADELGDEPELEQVLRQHLGQDGAEVLLVGPADVGPEADALLADTALDDPLDPGERPSADEEDVRRVDLDELLVRVLAAALGRDRSRRALQDLEQRLLHTLAGDVAGDRRVLGLAGDLVDLVDVDDPGLGLLDVVVGRLDQLEEEVLDVFPDVAGFRQRRGVGDGERDVEEPGHRL